MVHTRRRADTDFLQTPIGAGTAEGIHRIFQKGTPDSGKPNHQSLESAHPELVGPRMALTGPPCEASSSAPERRFEE